MHQYEAVAAVMRENGGFATLKHLYQHAPNVQGSEWGTKTPNASIRRIVQERDRFFRIRPGLWALEGSREELPAHLSPDVPSAEQAETYSHWHFQGLLGEVGQVREAETWIPSQDKNREFLDTTLNEVRTLESIPEFGYDWMVSRAETIDVVWFNDRRMPDSLFEVEFSTDFQNSLHKFLDLQDFDANFVIVADENRKGQFEKRLTQTGFAPIRGRTTFFNFEDVSDLHAGATRAEEQFGQL
jgi:hypothetical protein